MRPSDSYNGNTILVRRNFYMETTPRFVVTIGININRPKKRLDTKDYNLISNIWGFKMFYSVKTTECLYPQF